MPNEILIRTVTVELLRAGPAHNQLLSPLTPYLGVCDDAEAGVVNLPFEHASFLRRMKSMRYTAGVDDDGRSDRLPVLRELGVDMAKLLGAIPRLPGALGADAGGPDTLVHLRLVLSASELASLPFEQAKIPISPTAYSEGWLSLQAKVPVVVTRRTRNVSEGGVIWPSRPRVLFVCADPAEVPFAQHKAALIDAVRPYLKPGQQTPVVGDAPNRSQYGELLTILENASFNQVIDECGRHRYTHVHLLAHGAEDSATEERRYGLALKGAGGDVDVISGERLASAFACLVGGAIHRPAVVVLATCDSANQAAVMTPGASIAHVLHQAGIAMVVASQYPLSKEGSELLTSELYPGLLRGENPWILLHRIRTGLHSRVMGHSHDWASLVVYEALPANLADQLEDLQYHQSRLAINVALECIDRAVADAAQARVGLPPERVTGHHESLHRASEWLPLQGRFITECLGLRASSKKRLAEAEFNIACNASDAEQAAHVRSSLIYLDQSLEDYRLAVDSILVNRPGQAVQRAASLHWVLVQQLCLSAVLGKAPPEGAWETARLSAEAHLELRDAEERAWALGSLIELWLLKTVDPRSTPAACRQAVDKAVGHANKLVRMFSSTDAFPIQSTRQQLMRYTRWWSHELIEAVLAQQYPDYPSWKTLGVVDAAKTLIEALDGRSTLGRIASAEDDGSTVAAPASTPAEPPPDDLLASEPKEPRQPTRPSAADAFLRIDMLPALHGDCLWIEYGQGATVHRVLIDCGTSSTFPLLQARIAALPEADRLFEMLILSHIDDDHIGGAIPLLQDRALGTRFGNIWFNGWKHLRPDQPERLGAVQGEVFSGLIVKHGHPWNLWPERGADGGTIVVPETDELPTHTLPGGMRLTLLSPTPDKLVPLRRKWQKDVEAKGMVPGVAPAERLGRTVSTSTDVVKLAKRDFKDNTPHNGSSIAVLAEYGGKAVLLGADAHWPVLLDTVQRHLAAAGTERLRLDAFKVPHHGSRNNLSNALLGLLDCRCHLVSSNGNRFNHPDREAIAKLIVHGGPQARLQFNYRSELNAVWADPALQQKYGYTAHYPEADDDAGLRVPL